MALAGEGRQRMYCKSHPPTRKCSHPLCELTYTMAPQAQRMAIHEGYCIVWSLFALGKGKLREEAQLQLIKGTVCWTGPINSETSACVFVKEG